VQDRRQRRALLETHAPRTDRIDALAADRTALWDRLADAAFLTLNEKREAVGYAPVPGGDRLE
jgi:phage portal protein BeeE